MDERRADDDPAFEIVPAAAGRLPSGSLRRLLACVDGSAESEGTLSLGMTIAKACSAPITLLRTMEPGPTSYQVPATGALGWELTRSEAMQYLEALRARLAPPDVTVDLSLETGHAAATIVSVAREIHADLILLGRHGRRGDGGWHLSGTAAEVIECAPTPVLLVPLPAQPPSGLAPLRRILVPLDGSQRAESALAPAVRLGSACGAELVVVHVVPSVELTGSAPLEAEERELVERLKRRNQATGERYLERIEERLGGAEGRARTMLIDAPVLDTLLELPEQLDVDLVVMSAHGASGSSRWAHGSVAGQMIRNSGRALLIVQDLSPAQLAHCLGHATRSADAPHLGHVHFHSAC